MSKEDEVFEASIEMSLLLSSYHFLRLHAIYMLFVAVHPCLALFLGRKVF